jgi:multiple sugar transport system permease protein
MTTWKKFSYRKHSPQILAFIITLALVMVLVFPLAWMVRISLSPKEGLFVLPIKLLPSSINLSGYIGFFSRPLFLRFYLNSMLVATGTVATSLFAGTLAGYSFARFSFKGRNALMMITLSAQMFPWALLLISLYIFYINVNLFNSLFGLVLAHSTFALPLTIWILKGYFSSIPKDLEQAAAIDGCGKVETLVRIILPLARPGIAAAGIYIFLFSWNDFLFGLTLTTDDFKRTLSPGISMQFIGEFEFLWIDMMAASVLVTLPILVLFIIFQRQFIQGLTAGAVKG